MICRCGHGRNLHRPTSKGMAYAAAQRRAGRKYPTKNPCTGLAGRHHTYCKCRDFTPAKGVQG